MNAGQKMAHWVFCLIGTVGLGISSHAFAQQTPVPLIEMFDADQRKLTETITEIANRTANERAWFDTDYRPLSIRVTLDLDRNGVAFDMEDRLSHEAGFTEMVDMHRAIESELEPVLAGVKDLGMFRWTYGGKSLDEISGDADGSNEPSNRRVPEGTTTEPPVVVAAGHGHYYNHRYNDWRPHRTSVNGVLEDDITPKFASELMFHLSFNRVAATELRPDQGGLVHQPSGLSWARVGVRYFLEKWLPEEPGIWHSLPSATDAGRERREDLISRPLYANHLGSPAIIHLHTNAAKQASANGARVYVHSERPQSAKLGKLALCSMKEMIHSIDRFKGFSIANEPHVADDDAENSRAKVPSIIVETAFHTNESDADLIKDPEFRKVSMMGVAKAYRLFKEGLTCEDFAISNAEDVEVPIGKEAKIPVQLQGNPVFPVTVRYLPSRCYREPCSASSKSLYSVAEVDRFRIQHFCSRDDIGKEPIEYRITAKDSLGVMTKEKVFRLTCVQSAAG